MKTDARLEELSDKVRMGTPIGFWEAMEVIEYQNMLKEERRKNNIWVKIKNWFMR